MAWTAAAEAGARRGFAPTPVAAQETHHGLVDQGTRVQRVVAALASHQPSGDPHQLAVDGPDQSVLGVRNAGADLAEHDGQVMPLFHAHRVSLPVRSENRLSSCFHFFSWGVESNSRIPLGPTEA